MTFQSLRCSILLLLALTAGLFVAEYGASFSEPMQTAPAQELRGSAVNVITEEEGETSGSSIDSKQTPEPVMEFVSFSRVAIQESQNDEAPLVEPSSNDESVDSAELPSPQEASSDEGERQDPTSLTPELQRALELVPGSVAAVAVPLPPLPEVELKGRVIGADGGATVMLEIGGVSSQLSITPENNSIPVEFILDEVAKYEAAVLAGTVIQASGSQSETWELVHVSAEKVLLRGSPWNRMIELR